MEIPPRTARSSWSRFQRSKFRRGSGSAGGADRRVRVPTGSSGEDREAGTEAGVRGALTQLGGCGGAATGRSAGEGQEVRPVRLCWELLAELVQESRSAARSSSVCLQVLTS